MADASPRVLFVEDQSDTRELVEFSLGREGLNVVSVDTAEEGLARAREGAFALILLDIGLPDKDGLELCRAIRRFDAKTPILFHTAFADLLEENDVFSAGAQGFVRKPEDTIRLGSIIRETIERAKSRTSDE